MIFSHVSFRRSRWLYLLNAATLPCVFIIGSNGALAQTAASAYTTGYRYDKMGHLVGTISPDPDGTGPLHYGAVRNTYDGIGRLTKVEKGELAAWQSEGIEPSAWTGFTVFQSVETSYDVLDHKIQEQARTGSGGAILTVTQYSYDPVGRLECTAQRMNPAIFGSLPASACSLGAEGTGANDFGPDRITKNSYDAAGQLVQVRAAVATGLEQAYATYSYTPNGKQQDVIDANGNHAQLTYDGFDRKSGWYLSSPTAAVAFDGASQASALATAGAVSTTDFEAYTYDANDNMVTRRLRNGSQITYGYDNLNRLASKTLPAGNPNLNSAYTYDLMGRLTLMTSTSPNNVYSTSTAYTYDGFGRVMSEAETLNGVTHTISSTYDADSNRITLNWNGVTPYITYNYDGLDRMSAINQNASNNLIGFTYDSAGRRQALTRANGTSTVYGYDGISRLNDLKLMSGSTITNEYGLSFTPANEVSQRTISNDAFAWTGAVAVNRSYTANGLNQYNGITGIATPTYDPKGNLTSAGGSTYSYSAENELATQDTYRFYYDPHHRLLFDTQNGIQLVYDGDNVVAEYSRSNQLARRYVFGPNPDEPLFWYEGASGIDKRWLAADTQGSVVWVANSGGTLAINSYDEYGIPASSSETYASRFRYTGQQWITNLGMYYYKARIYSPTLGRFLQADPVGYGDQINLYSYVANDPINSTDTSGTCTGSHEEDTAGNCISPFGVDSTSSDSYGNNEASVKSSTSGTTTTITHADGTIEARRGTPAFRDNNPGNIHPGDFTKNHGQIGVDPKTKYGGPYAVFENTAAGRAALSAMINTPQVGSRTIEAEMARYASSSGDDPAGYAKKIADDIGVNVTAKISSLTSAQREIIVQAIVHQEGSVGTVKWIRR